MDVVFDTVSGENFRRAYTPFNPGGFLVPSVASPAERSIVPPTSAKQWYFNKIKKHRRSFILFSMPRFP